MIDADITNCAGCRETSVKESLFGRRDSLYAALLRRRPDGTGERGLRDGWAVRAQPRLTIAAAIGTLALAAATLGTGVPREPLYGFTPERSEQQRRLERRLTRFASPSQIESFHRVLTAEPHMAGSARNLALAEWISDRWQDWGLEAVTTVRHDMLLPHPEEIIVEMTRPEAWQARLREEPLAHDPDTAADAGLAFHAYSASGEIEASVVYVGDGHPGDYDWLAEQGIDVRGRIVLARYSEPYSYRGYKAFTAQARGAAGILIFSDPAIGGSARGPAYPEGPWAPPGKIERGSIAYSFLVPGDPLTPGWSSVPGAPRLAAAEAPALPRILSAPLSAADAAVVLASLEGPRAPARWQGGLPLTYRAGPGPATIRLRVRTDDRVRPVWTVIGMIRGATEPEKVVILGNHRDAWTHGGVDPSSGTAALMEVARALGALVQDGWRPHRSILLASWDAEEFSLGSSTEWGEQHERWLREDAVAYLNVDSAVSGPRFTAAAVPSLNRLIAEVAALVRDPDANAPLAAVRRAEDERERGGRWRGDAGDFVNNRLGSGSDYSVFLHFLGVPIADLSFQGPYGVYHSIYDTHQWVAGITDPGFRRHAALASLWSILAVRLANADILPFDYRTYAHRLEEFLDEIERQWHSSRVVRAPAEQNTGARDDLEPAYTALRRFAHAAAAIEREIAATIGTSDPGDQRALNRRLMAVERGLLDPAGLPGRPWYRHQIYAPAFSYAPQLLPGLSAALEKGDEALFGEQVSKLAAALDRAADSLANPESQIPNSEHPKSQIPNPFLESP